MQKLNQYQRAESNRKSPIEKKDKVSESLDHERLWTDYETVQLMMDASSP